MESIHIINSLGESLLLGYTDPPYYLFPESIAGLTDCTIEAATVRGYKQNGADYLGTYAQERVIAFSFYIQSDRMGADPTGSDLGFYAYRRRFAQVVNPLLGDCTIRYVNDFRARRIQAHCTQMPTEQEHYGSLRKYTVQFTASFPYWLSDDEHAAHMNEIVGGWTLPFNFMSEQPGINFGVAQNRAIVDNDGDIEMPIRIEISAGAVNPKVRIVSTGEYIKVATTIPAGQKMIINTSYGDKSAILVNAATGAKISDAFNLLDPGSTFFSVPIGKQVLVYTSDDANLADIWVYWRNLYLGI
jgi:hypothetical protein